MNNSPIIFDATNRYYAGMTLSEAKKLGIDKSFWRRDFHNIDSKILLRKTVDLIATKGYRVGNIDATVCAERPKLKSCIPAMQECLAHVMDVDPDDVSIKATTTEKLGFTGREEGISAYATVLIEC